MNQYVWAVSQPNVFGKSSKEGSITHIQKLGDPVEKILTQKMIEDYQNDGVVFIPGMFKQSVEKLRSGIEQNMKEPGPCNRKPSRAWVGAIFWRLL